MFKLQSISAFCLLAALVGFAGEARAWTHFLSSVGTNSLNAGRVAAFLSNGDAIVAGENNGHFLVARERGSGGQAIWRSDAGQPPVTPCERVLTVTVTASDDVLAAGQGCGSLRLQKLDGATGAELWTWERVTPDPNQFAAASAEDVVLDAAGNAFVVGFMNPLQGDIVAVIAKLDPDGNELWVTEYSPGPPQFPSGPDFALAAAVDSQGDVVAAGKFGGFMALAKFDGSSGTKLWQAKIDPAGVTAGSAAVVAVDAQDDVVVAGQTLDGVSGNDLTVAKLSGADGSPLWHHVAAGSNATDIAVDASGDVLVVGQVAAFDEAAFKLAGSDGNEIWSSDVLPRNPSGYDSRLVLLEGGDVVLSTADVTRLAGGDGSTLWTHPLVTDPDEFQRGWVNIAADAAGDVLVVGQSIFNGGDYHVVSSKLNGTSGTSFANPRPLPALPGFGVPLLALALVAAALGMQGRSASGC